MATDCQPFCRSPCCNSAVVMGTGYTNPICIISPPYNLALKKEIQREMNNWATRRERERWRRKKRKRQGPGGPSAPPNHYYTGKDGEENIFKELDRKSEQRTNGVDK